MSYETKAQATTAARACRNLLTTKGWKICVHENLGWHWCLEHADGHFTLHQFDGYPTPRYWTLMSDGEYRHAGSMNWTPRGKVFKRPDAAVTHQLKLANNYAKQTMEWVTKVTKAIKGNQ